MNRTAEDVRMMEDELRELRSIAETQDRRLAIADNEVARLKVENVLLQRKADDSLEKAIKIETIMMQTASGLMAGLKEMKEERELARTLRRQVQEDQMTEDTGQPPAFLRDPNPAHRPPTPEEREVLVNRREAGMLSRDPVRPGKVDTEVAGRDSRLPGVKFAQSDDERSLKRLADGM